MKNPIFREGLPKYRGNYSGNCLIKGGLGQFGGAFEGDVDTPMHTMRVFLALKKGSKSLLLRFPSPNNPLSAPAKSSIPCH